MPPISEEQKLRQREAYWNLRLIVLAHYSPGGIPRCACCGETVPEYLTFDHEGGRGTGAAHRREVARDNRAGRGLNLAAWLKKNGFPPGFRVLCYNCNCSLGFRGYCPHQGRPESVSVAPRPARPRGRPRKAPPA